MKPIDDTKIPEVNIELENRFKTEREEWKDKIITLVKSIGDTRKLSEAQIQQLSFRQIVQEKLAEYRILQEKRQEIYDKQYTSRFREYHTGYDLKLSNTEKNIFVQSDCSAIKSQIKMISVQITYFEECVKTLDNLGFAIKNKIEIVSQQLM